MMVKIVMQTLRQKRNTIFGFGGASLLFLILYISIFPTFQDQQENLKALVKAYPEGLLKAFNLRRELLSGFTLETFLAMEMFSFMWPVITISFLLAFGSSSISGEVENGTIDLLLSRPLSRMKLFAAKYIASVIAFTIYLVLSFLLVIPLAPLFDVEVKLSHYLTATILLTAFALAVLGISFLSSAAFSEKGRANMAAGGAIAVMYFANLMAGLVDKVNHLKYFSIFYYFDSVKALVDNEITGLSLIALLGLAALTTGLAAFIFNRKDIAG